jgi:hypothetical protein
VSINELAVLAGFERPQVLYDVMHGRTSRLSVKVMSRLVEAFPECNPAWLVTGEGEPFISAPPMQNNTESMEEKLKMALEYNQHLTDNNKVLMETNKLLAETNKQLGERILAISAKLS